MRGIQHLILTVLLGSIAAAYALQPDTLTGIIMYVLCVMFMAWGSIAPDIDVKKSMTRRWYTVLPFLPFMIGYLGVYWILGTIYKFRHRGVMHSLIGLSVSFAMVAFLASWMVGPEFAKAIYLGFGFGYLAHLIEDSITTKKPVEWLPAPRFLAVLLLATLMLTPSVMCATEIKPISFEDTEKNVQEFMVALFLFTFGIMVLYAGICAFMGNQAKAILVVKGIVIGLLIAYVLGGVVMAWVGQ